MSLLSLGGEGGGGGRGGKGQGGPQQASLAARMNATLLMDENGYEGLATGGDVSEAGAGAGVEEAAGKLPRGQGGGAGKLPAGAGTGAGELLQSLPPEVAAVLRERWSEEQEEERGRWGGGGGGGGVGGVGGGAGGKLGGGAGSAGGVLTTVEDEMDRHTSMAPLVSAFKREIL